MTDDNRLQLCDLVLSALKSIDDFRGKLLALLPLASGAGGIVLLTQSVSQSRFVPIAVFGLLITVGLLIYERRNLRLCGELLEIGNELEKQLKLEESKVRPFHAWDKKGGSFEVASYLIYGTVLIGWVLLFLVGAGCFPLPD